MESISLQQLRVVEDQLIHIKEAISLLQEWNRELRCVDDLLLSPSGMKTLAADCMLIEAIGENVKRIDEKTNGQLFVLRPEIPWNLVKGMRNHIAHGYFDITMCGMSSRMTCSHYEKQLITYIKIYTN